MPSTPVPSPPVRALALSSVACVHPQEREALGEAISHEFQQELDTFPGLDVCAMDSHCKHQALGVHEKVAFSTLNLLAACVYSLFSTYPGSFDRLAVFEASTRSRTALPRIRSPLCGHAGSLASSKERCKGTH